MKLPIIISDPHPDIGYVIENICDMLGLKVKRLGFVDTEYKYFIYKAKLSDPKNKKALKKWNSEPHYYGD